MHRSRSICLPNLRLKDLAVSDSGLVFDPASGTIATSNATGVRILRALCEGKSIQEITDQLTIEYDAPPQVVEADIQDFIVQLGEQGYLNG